MDHLEKFIKNNKSKFQEPVPNPDVIWANIEREIRKPKVFKFRRILRVAAAIAILLGSFFAVKFTLENNKMMKSFELAQLEETYSPIIQAKYKSLDQDALTEEILEDFKALQSIHQSLLENINQLPPESRTFLLEALKNNYESQVSLLDAMTEQNLISDSIKKSKNEKYSF